MKILFSVCMFFCSIVYSQSEKFNFDFLKNSNSKLSLDQKNALLYYFGNVSFENFENSIKEGRLASPSFSELLDRNDYGPPSYLNSIEKSPYVFIVDTSYYENLSTGYLISKAENFIESQSKIRFKQDSLIHNIQDIIQIDYDRSNFLTLKNNKLLISASLTNLSNYALKEVYGKLSIIDEYNNVLLQTNLNSNLLPKSTLNFSAMSFKSYYDRMNGDGVKSSSLYDSWNFMVPQNELHKLVDVSNLRLEFIPTLVKLKSGRELK